MRAVEVTPVVTPDSPAMMELDEEQSAVDPDLEEEELNTDQSQLTGDKAVRRSFSFAEDEKILRAVFANNPDVMRDGAVERSFFEKLATELKRTPKDIYYRWSRRIQHVLVRFEAGMYYLTRYSERPVFHVCISPPGTLNDVDYYGRIIDYMADNGFNRVKGVNWTEVTSKPGLTGIVVRSCLELFN